MEPFRLSQNCGRRDWSHVSDAPDARLVYLHRVHTWRQLHHNVCVEDALARKRNSPHFEAGPEIAGLTELNRAIKSLVTALSSMK